MSDAQNESVDDLDAAIAAELDALEAPEPVEEAEVVEEVTEAPEEVAEQPEQPEEPAEELLRPHDHWPEAQKTFFNGLTRSQQEIVMERERNFEESYRQRSTELSQAKRFVEELHGIIQPVVNDWARQGLKPDAGIRRAIALEKALKENPAETLMQLAQERGVDLKQEWAEQPYVDPQTLQLQKELREMRQQHQEFLTSQEQARQTQAQAARQEAEGQILAMRNATDESGNPKYPYMETLVPAMTAKLEGGQAKSLESAYELALQELRTHPAIKDLISTQTTEVVTARQAEAEKAKAASKAVDSNSTGSTATPKTIDQDILDSLEAAGIT